MSSFTGLLEIFQNNILSRIRKKCCFGIYYLIMDSFYDPFFLEQVETVALIEICVQSYSALKIDNIENTRILILILITKRIVKGHTTNKYN